MLLGYPLAWVLFFGVELVLWMGLAATSVGDRAMGSRTFHCKDGYRGNERCMDGTGRGANYTPTNLMHFEPFPR